MDDGTNLARRAALAGAATLLAAPAFAATCQIGPAPHEKGPPVWRDMDQVELDAAYDQSVYAPLGGQILRRYASASDTARAHLGAPQRVAYGPSEAEKLDIYRARHASAPIFVFVHGGAWLGGAARDYGYPAEMFVRAGAHYIALDFANVRETNGDLTVMVAQVRRAVAWVWHHAASFGGDRNRLFLGGHSSGGHLAGVALVTDWHEYGLPDDALRGGLCMSAMFDMQPVRLSKRSSYVTFTDANEDALSALRHLDKLRAPLIVTTGGNETPEFQRQARDFVTAAHQAGKRVELVEAPDHNHFEMGESLGNPYGPNGRAALRLMGLTIEQPDQTGRNRQ